MGLLSNILGGGVKETLDTVFSGIDKLTTTKEEKEILRLKAIELSIGDRDAARAMYNTDNKLQKIFAIVFLFGYISITSMVLYGAYQMAATDTVFNNETVAIITMLFTAMSNKINTIVDFLFGGSSSQEKDK